MPSSPPPSSPSAGPLLTAGSTFLVLGHSYAHTKDMYVPDMLCAYTKMHTCDKHLQAIEARTRDAHTCKAHTKHICVYTLLVHHTLIQTTHARLRTLRTHKFARTRSKCCGSFQIQLRRFFPRQDFPGPRPTYGSSLKLHVLSLYSLKDGLFDESLLLVTINPQGQ